MYLLGIWAASFAENNTAILATAKNPIRASYNKTLIKTKIKMMNEMSLLPNENNQKISQAEEMNCLKN